jgi:hypothetical protein
MAVLASLPTLRPADGIWLVAGDVFAAPNNVGDFFSTRIRGVFVPLVTGSHEFMILADECGILFLSKNRDPIAKVRIAETKKKTNGYDNAEQISKSVWLEAGLCLVVC